MPITDQPDPAVVVPARGQAEETDSPYAAPATRLVPIGLLGAGLVALAVSAQTYLSMPGHGHSFWRMLAWQACAWSFWAFLAPLVCRMGALLSMHRPDRARQIAWVVGLALVLIGAHVAMAAQFTVWIQPNLPAETHDFSTSFVALFRSLLATDWLAYLLLLFVGSTLAVGHRARQLAIRESRLEAELARATLQALRLEIQPHFLFNTLNSIAALIRIKANDKALEMLLGLSDLLRTTVEREPAHVTPLASELEFTRRYIDLQRARFGERLTVEYAIAPESEACSVPTFLLQPLVENAFRHGIARKAGHRCLVLGSLVDHGRLRVWVSDDGAGLPSGFRLEQHAGMGLSNIRVRLQHLYGVAGTLLIAPGAAGGTVVTVTLPATRRDGAVRATA